MTPLVLVHGNPEIDVVWDPLVAALGRDALQLSPPGFGAPVAPGFQRTPAGYCDWLVAELERVGEPVDLIGHDWGGIHVANAVMARPDLVRTWASDSIGALHPDYVWHELAQVWQRTPDGERFVAAALRATAEERSQRFTARGMPADLAIKVADGFDATMGETILALYRAARQPVLARLGEGLARAAARPGLVLIATADDAVGTLAQRHEVAARTGADVAVLEGAGHWWLTEPHVSAAAVVAFRALWG